VIRRWLSRALVLSLPGGCQVAGAAPVDALLLVEDSRSRTIVQEAMQDALGVSSITLARTAFSNASLLTLSPGASRKIGRPDADARMSGPPEQFRLLLLDGRCALLRVRTGASIPLVDVLCQPVGIEAGD